MPIRIKPVYDLGLCVLDLESIKGICTLVDQNFSHARYSAEDGIWEVYDEQSQEFMTAISSHETLDSFSVKAENRIVENITAEGQTNRTIEMIFDKTQATLKFSAPFEQQNWFEHFLIDLRKHLRPPLLRQRLLAERSEGNLEPIPVAIISIRTAILIDWLTDYVLKSSRARYCYIILRRNPPNPFVENIKANLVSNLIWLVFVFIAGFVFAFLALWIFRRFGVNVNDWLTPPSIPTATPSP